MVTEPQRGETQRISVTLDQGDMDALAEYAKAHGMRPAEAARRAVQAMLAGEGEAVQAVAPVVAPAAPAPEAAPIPADVARLALDLRAALTMVAGMVPSVAEQAAAEARQHQQLKYICESFGHVAVKVVTADVLAEAFGGGE